MDLKDRIRELAAAVGIDLAVPQDPDRCWVDARIRCPYGSPEGQYVLRPESYCHREYTRGDGCAVFQRHVHDPVVEQEEKDDAIREHFDEHSQSLSGVLFDRAKHLPERTPNRLALELAGLVLDDRTLDVEVLVQEQLPKPQERVKAR